MAKNKGLRYYTELSFLTSDLILKNLPFILFLGFLAITYIAGAHYAERNVRQIQTLQKEVKELRWYFMSLQAENMYESQRSEVADKVRKEGLRPFGDNPKIVIIEE